MIKENLLEKIRTTQSMIILTENNVSRYCKKLNINDKELLKHFNNYFISNNDVKDFINKYISRKNEYNSSNRLIEKHIQYNHKIELLETHLKKLFDLNQKIKKYQNKYNLIINEENIGKIEIIWNFFEQWENKTYEWYIKNSKLYFELNKNYETTKQNYLNSDKFKEKLNRYLNDSYIRQYYRTEYNIRTMILNNFYKQYYENIDIFTKQITKITKIYKLTNTHSYENTYYDYTYHINEELLKSTLKEEKENMYKKLIKRVNSYVGEIIDAKNLYIGLNGELNGIIIGKEGKVNIETITAGGFNIQKFHFRVLIKRIK